MYAGDIKISLSSNSIYTINNAVNEDLMLLRTWLGENVTKTQSLLKESRYEIEVPERPDSFKSSLSIGNELISSAADTKYLGLHVDKSLNWKQHNQCIAHNQNRFQRNMHASIRKTISPFENYSENAHRSY